MSFLRFALTLAFVLSFIVSATNAATLPCSTSWGDGVTSGDWVESCLTPADIAEMNEDDRDGVSGTKGEAATGTKDEEG